MITEKQLQSQGYRETNRTADVATYERSRPFAERFFKGLLAALCTITVIPLFFMERAVKQMWAEAFSPVDRKIVAVAKSILPAPPLAEGETAALPPPSPLLKPSLPSSISTSHPPLADRSPPSTAAGGAGASSSVGITDAQLPSSIPKSPESGLTTAEVPSSSRITSIYRRPLADRSPASTAAGGAGAASSTSAIRSSTAAAGGAGAASSVTMASERKGWIISLKTSAGALEKDSSVASASLPLRPPEEIGPLNKLNELCNRLMRDKNAVNEQVNAVKQELDLLLKGYVERSSKLPEIYKNQFKELASFEERLEYLVIDDPNSRSIVEQTIEAFERIEKQQASMYTGHYYFPTGLLEVGEALKNCLNNHLFTTYQEDLAQDSFILINTDEFQHPFAEINWARDAEKDKAELKEDLVFLICLNRCPPLAKAAIDSHFGGELTRVEGILNSKGLLSPEDKKTLDILRTNINFYMGENSPLNKRLMARLQEGLKSDFTALIESTGMSATDKLNKIFNDVSPTYFREDVPEPQEFLQAFEQGCFELLLSGIDLRRVSKDLRNAFLENLQYAELFIGSHWSGRSEISMESRFLKIAKENPEYFSHLKSLKLQGSAASGHDTGQIGRDLYAFLVTPDAKKSFPRLEELQLSADQLPANTAAKGYYEPGTDYLLRIIQNISTLKVIKLHSKLNLLSSAIEAPIDYEGLKRKFSAALRAEVNVGFSPTTITIGERAE